MARQSSDFAENIVKRQIQGDASSGMDVGTCRVGADCGSKKRVLTEARTFYRTGKLLFQIIGRNTVSMCGSGSDPDKVPHDDLNDETVDTLSGITCRPPCRIEAFHGESPDSNVFDFHLAPNSAAGMRCSAENRYASTGRYDRGISDDGLAESMLPVAAGPIELSRTIVLIVVAEERLADTLNT